MEENKKNTKKKASKKRIQKSRAKPGMTAAEYARHRGVTLNAVRYALRKGIISYPPNSKKLDPEYADLQWAQNSNEQPKTKNYNPGKQAPQDPEIQDDEFGEMADDQDVGFDDPPVEQPMTLVQANIRKALADGRKKELEVAEMEGRLIDRKKADEALFRLGKMIHGNLMNIPARIKDEIASVVDPYEVEDMLRQEFTDALKGLSDELKRMADSGPGSEPGD